MKNLERELQIYRTTRDGALARLKMAVASNNFPNMEKYAKLANDADSVVKLLEKVQESDKQ